MVRTLQIDKRVCAACDSEDSVEKCTGWQHWHFHDGCWLCKKCYIRYVRNPAFNKKYHSERQNFKGKMIQLGFNPRNGVCERCGNVKGMTCMRTSKHHYFYMTIMPWACTEELCNSCHEKEEWRLGRHNGTPVR